MKSTPQTDPVLLLSALAATLFGLFAIWDAGYARAAVNGQVFPREFVYQSVIGVGSVAIGLFLGRFPGRVWKKLPWPGLTVTAILLALVSLIGKEINGAKRWIGFGSFTIQPAELAKVACIVFLAAMLARRTPWRQPKTRTFSTWFTKVFLHKVARAWYLWIVLAVAVVIELEPDLATATVLVMTSLAMLVVGRVSTRSLLALGGAIVLVLGLLVLKEPYRLARLVNHGDRWAEANIESIGYQTTQSEMAFASGGMIGVGLGEGRAKHTLPAPTTDFILATVGEEFGLVGSLAVIGLLGVVTWRLYRAGARHKDMFARLVLTGTATWIGVQTVVNVMMVNGHFASIGVPLPFFSYGGTSLLAIWMALGISQSVSTIKPKEEDTKPSGQTKPARRSGGTTTPQERPKRIASLR